MLHIQGHEEEGYGKRNPMEYFAEGSEAFFGTNDFYPFVSAELKRHDPRLFELLKELWNGESANSTPCDRPNERSLA